MKKYPLISFGLTILLTIQTNTSFAAISNKMLAKVRDVPCDGVDYPVAVSVNSYTEDAGTTIRLNKNVRTILTATHTTSETDQVSDTYSDKVTINIGFEPKIGLAGTEATLKGSVAYEWSHTKSYTHSTQVTFAQAQAITITPTTSNMTATPTFFKKQVWGRYYKCESGSKRRMQQSASDAIRLDIVVAQGWVLRCPNRKNAVCDIKNDYISP